MKEQDAKTVNTTALAYMGDAVYEVAVRKYMLETGQVNGDKLHKLTIGFVRAEGQALAIKTLMKELTPEEQALVRRARNKKTTSKPQNVDPVIYKLATAFEALAGWLYLSGDAERLRWLVGQSIGIISRSKGSYPVRQKPVPQEKRKT